MQLIELTAERRDLLGTPARRPFSLRRTTSLQLSWPDGPQGVIHVLGLGRDLLTQSVVGECETLVLDRVDAVLDADRNILSLACEPPLPADVNLVGQSALRGLRKAIAPALAPEGYATRPLAQLLDDFVGASVISNWIIAKWAQGSSGIDRRTMENVCTGYRSGSTSFTDMRNLRRSYIVPAAEVADDPCAFHELGPLIEATVRRLRRTDVWRDGERLMIDALFSDSGVLGNPVHRSAIHEYRLLASAVHDDGQWRLASIEAKPGALPYDECRAAPDNLDRLIGMPLPELRPGVLRDLRGPLGCTHLNDTARTLAEAGVLAQQLAERTAS